VLARAPELVLVLAIEQEVSAKHIAISVELAAKASCRI